MFWIIILTLAGIFLIAAEIYLPGAILGIFGVLALLVATGIGFVEFGFAGGSLFAILLFCVSCAGVMIGLRIFPRTAMGKKMTLQTSLVSGSSQLSMSDLLGVEGRAITMLRPSGTAMLNGHRYDVVAESGLLSKDTAVRVVGVEGAKIIVSACI